MMRNKRTSTSHARLEPLEERRHMSVVNVAVRAADANATEGGADGATLLVTRSKALPTPTRVFFSIGGSARGARSLPASGIDYDVFAMTVPNPSQTIGFTTRDGNKPYVVIGAGRTSTTVVLASRDDSEVEATETAVFTIQRSAAYTVSNASSATLNITDNDFLTQYRINFQSAGSPAPAGYSADTGLTFGERGPGLRYGWDVNNTANAFTRNNLESPDARYDSFNQMQANGANRNWEIALPNGTYMVRLVAGDPSTTDSIYAMSLEGNLALSGKPNGILRHFRQTTVLEVKDGRLTLGNFLGSFKNRIDFIDIKLVARRSVLGTVAAVSAPLKVPGTEGIWQQQPNGLFSDNQIDEPLWL